jgi:hypothetical protein
MKTILLLLSFLSFGTYSFSQNSFQILPESKLTITGETNINKFLCAFNTTLIPNTKNIKFEGNSEKIHFENAVLKLDNQGFDCGNKAINKDFKALIKSSEYPEIKLELKELILKSPHEANALLRIFIAGKQKDYRVPITINEYPVVQYSGKLNLNINDFELTPPKKIFGLIVVKEDIEINFNLIVEILSNVNYASFIKP